MLCHPKQYELHLRRHRRQWYNRNRHHHQGHHQYHQYYQHQRNQHHHQIHHHLQLVHLFHQLRLILHQKFQFHRLQHQQCDCFCIHRLRLAITELALALTAIFKLVTLSSKKLVVVNLSIAMCNRSYICITLIHRLLLVILHLNHSCHLASLPMNNILIKSHHQQ